MDEHRRLEREERMELYGITTSDEEDSDNDETLGGFIVSNSDEDACGRSKSKKKHKKVWC